MESRVFFALVKYTLASDNMNRGFMSGPKAVNIRIHNAILKQIILKQSEIRILEDSLNSFGIKDIENQYQFSGSDLVQENKEDIMKCMESVELPKETVLSANQNLALVDEINKKMMHLLKTISKLKEAKKKCEEIHSNYTKSIQTHNELLRICKEKSLRLNKMIQRMEENILELSANSSHDDTQKYTSRLKQICTTYDLPAFNLDLHKNKKVTIKEIIAFYQRQENEVFELQSAYHSSINLRSIKPQLQNQRTDLLQQSRDNDIISLFDSIPDSETKRQLYQDYDYLIHTPEYAGKSSFQHIKSKLLLVSQSIERRNELILIEKRISLLPQNEKTVQFNTLLRKQISADIISETSFVKLCKAWEALEAEQLKNQELQYYQEQENRFIKEKLVKALQELSYTVVSDAKGLSDISNSFLFKVPKQENYIYVEYLKGKFLYNFMVPEKVADLSREELQRKVAEMCKACDGFLLALEKLKAIGMNFDYTYKEASEQYVISIPLAIRKAIKDEVLVEKQHRVTAKKDLVMKHDYE